HACTKGYGRHLLQRTTALTTILKFMKKTKVLFSFVAFLLAIGAAFASKTSASTMVQGYIQNGPQCIPSIQCSNAGGPQCRNTEGVPLYELSAGATQCIKQLTRNP